MKAAGVIVEYNPFHNGHLYHLKQTKQATNSDILIAVMSGNFLQRGEPALVSKWARAKMALLGGADLIIELPYVFATQNANTFAYGAISLLDHLFTKEVCFGSESGQTHDFMDAIQYLETHHEQYNEYIQTAMKTGVSYPRAASIAFSKMAGPTPFIDLTKPNNILGFQYILAIKARQSHMVAKTIKRTGAGYHDQTFDSHIASATSIRKVIQDQQQITAVRDVVPPATYDQLIEYSHTYQMLHDWESYFQLLKYKLLTMDAAELQNIYEAEEGLENRLLRFIIDSHSFAAFMQKIKTKRYTWTRLQRLCVHVLTGTNKQTMKEQMGEPGYVRLLGMNQVGQAYLNLIKKKVAIPIVTKPTAIHHPQLAIDLNAARIYAAALAEPYRSKMITEELTNSPIRIE